MKAPASIETLPFDSPPIMVALFIAHVTDVGLLLLLSGRARGNLLVVGPPSLFSCSFFFFFICFCHEACTGGRHKSHTMVRVNMFSQYINRNSLIIKDNSISCQSIA